MSFLQILHDVHVEQAVYLDANGRFRRPDGTFAPTPRSVERRRQQIAGVCLCRNKPHGDVPCQPVLCKDSHLQVSEGRIAEAKRLRKIRLAREHAQLRWRAQHGWYR